MCFWFCTEKEKLLLTDINTERYKNIYSSVMDISVNLCIIKQENKQIKNAAQNMTAMNEE